MRSHTVRARVVVRLLLAAAVSLPASAAAGQSAAGLVGPYWKAIELGGKPTAVQDASREALQGTSWQLVKFQGGDGTTLTPDDKANYAIEFGTDGQLTARIDCNRGRGAWKSSGPNRLELGPLALTRARCPAGSMHDQIVKQWGSIRSYVVKDGHLFLALMADGGIYEFEPFGSGGR